MKKITYLSRLTVTWIKNPSEKIDGLLYPHLYKSEFSFSLCIDISILQKKSNGKKIYIKTKLKYIDYLIRNFKIFL